MSVGGQNLTEEGERNYCKPVTMRTRKRTKKTTMTTKGLTNYVAQSLFIGGLTKPRLKPSLLLGP